MGFYRRGNKSYFFLAFGGCYGKIRARIQTSQLSVSKCKKIKEITYFKNRTV